MHSGANDTNSRQSGAEKVLLKGYARRLVPWSKETTNLPKCFSKAFLKAIFKGMDGFADLAQEFHVLTDVQVGQVTKIL